MDREKELLSAFQRGMFLSMKNPTYSEWFERFILDEIKADAGRKGDITSTAILKGNTYLNAVVKSAAPGIIAGIEEAVYLYRKNGIKAIPRKTDGSHAKKGEILLELYGKPSELLRIERSALDIMQRMSGIATLTSEIIKKIGNRVHIAPTRKTYWRYLDKKAVYLGGGLTHRLALWESILIKDNHLTALKLEGVKDTISEALRRAAKSPEKSGFIEIEVGNVKEAVKAASALKGIKYDRPKLVMLDNMKPSEIRKAIDELKKRGFYDELLIEVSGGINANNIGKYLIKGVDVISMGYLTNSSKPLDIKQAIVR